MSQCLYEPFVKGRRCKNERDPSRDDGFCADCGNLVDLMRKSFIPRAGNRPRFENLSPGDN